MPTDGMTVLDKLVADQLENAKEIILGLLPVERIYLFGSYAWGTPHEYSDLDLFVVVGDELPGRDIDAASKVRMAFENRVTMPADILVRWKSDFDQRKMLPTLEYQIARSGILLYERVPGDSGGEFLLNEDDRVIMEEWFYRAGGDLKMVRLASKEMSSIPAEPFCWMSAQAAEKYLKGFLALSGTSPLKTHNLVDLCNLCACYNPRFQRILDDCRKLNEYGVKPRYPDPQHIGEKYRLTEADARSALDAVSAIEIFVLDASLPR